MGRIKGSGTGYVPSIFDTRFLKVVADLKSRGIDCFENSSRMEKMLGLTKGTFYKINNNVAGISKNVRNEVVRTMQLYFGVNPLFWDGTEDNMYNEGKPVVSDLINNYKSYKHDLETDDLQELSEFEVLRLEIKKLREKLELREEQIKQLNTDLQVKEDKIKTLKELVDTQKDYIAFMKKPA